jgi:hypothetical protein
MSPNCLFKKCSDTQGFATQYDPSERWILFGRGSNFFTKGLSIVQYKTKFSNYKTEVYFKCRLIKFVMVLHSYCICPLIAVGTIFVKLPIYKSSPLSRKQFLPLWCILKNIKCNGINKIGSFIRTKSFSNKSSALSDIYPF